jgi:hypothetical protein
MELGHADARLVHEEESVRPGPAAVGLVDEAGTGGGGMLGCRVTASEAGGDQLLCASVAFRSVFWRVQVGTRSVTKNAAPHRMIEVSV